MNPCGIPPAFREGVHLFINALLDGCICIYICIFFPFILDIKFVGRTSRGHTGFLIHLLSAVRALIFLARRIQPFLSLVDREVEFCVVVVVSHLQRIGCQPAFFLFFVFLFLVRKIPFAGCDIPGIARGQLNRESEHFSLPVSA